MDPCALHVNGAQLFAGRYRSGPYGEVETPYWSSFGARFVRRISTGKRSGVQEPLTTDEVRDTLHRVREQRGGSGSGDPR